MVLHKKKYICCIGILLEEFIQIGLVMLFTSTLVGLSYSSWWYIYLYKVLTSLENHAFHYFHRQFKFTKYVYTTLRNSNLQLGKSNLPSLMFSCCISLWQTVCYHCFISFEYPLLLIPVNSWTLAALTMHFPHWLRGDYSFPNLFKTLTFQDSWVHSVTLELLNYLMI